MCRGVFKYGFRAKFVKSLPPLTKIQLEIINSRYIDEVEAMSADYNRAMILFVLLTNLVTICGILIASFTTLQKASLLNDYWKDVIVWTTWALSLLLTLSNAFLSAFGIYRKYVLADVTIEKLHNEGWSFSAGVNRYKELDTDAAFHLLMSQIEQLLTNTKIKEVAGNTAGVNASEILGVPESADKKIRVDL
jgi:Protein of unknown function (DUF4231)